MTHTKMLSSPQAAKVLGVSVRTLANWRAEEFGPAFVQFSTQAVRYPEDKLLEYIAAHTKAGAL